MFPASSAVAVAVLLCCLGSRASAALVTQEKPPNFVIILADDVGFGDTELTCGRRFSNSTLCPRTPNIRNFANEDSSIWFQRFYAGSGTCSPTRASVLTGRNNMRGCISQVLHCHVHTWDCKAGEALAWNQFSIADAVRKANETFMTQFIGKWHMGDLFPKSSNKNAKYSNPGRLGFEEWSATHSHAPISSPNCGCFAPADWQPPETEPDVVATSRFPVWVNHSHPGQDCVIAAGQRLNESFGCVNYWTTNTTSSRGCTNSTPEIKGDDGVFYVRKFNDFVSRAVKSNRPFLSALFLHYIHVPHPPMPEFYEGAKASLQPEYVGALEQMDATFGDILATLKRHGVYDDTIIWFMSDNGPDCSGNQVCSHPLKYGRSTGGLHGCKDSPYEGGIRVPSILHWTNRIEKLNTSVPAVTHDILPTIMDVLGVRSPDNWALDGVSLTPFFSRAHAPKTRQEFLPFWWQDIHHQYAAIIDGDLKLIEETEKHEHVQEISWGLGCMREIPASSPAIFNLSSDPYEKKNLVAEAPHLYEFLHEKLQAWQASVNYSRLSETKCASRRFPAVGQPEPSHAD